MTSPHRDDASSLAMRHDVHAPSERSKVVLEQHRLSERHHPASDEERRRLLLKGRRLLDARLEMKRRTLAAATISNAPFSESDGCMPLRPHVGEQSGAGPVTTPVRAGSSHETVMRYQQPTSPSPELEEVETLRRDLATHLQSAQDQHYADHRLIEELQQEISMLRKQLHAMKESQNLHTPLRSNDGGTLPTERLHSVQYEDQLARLAAVTAEGEEQRRVLQARTEELEAEALALCKTIADLQDQLKDRDDQLASSLALIDDLEGRLVGGNGSSLAETAADGAFLSAAMPSPAATDYQMSLHQLEEQLHILAREKVSLERENEGQRDIISNLQTQWNSLVHEVQQRERLLTDEVHMLRQKVAEASTSSNAALSSDAPPTLSRSSSAVSNLSTNPEYVHTSKLEELKQALYAQFNQHIAQYQELNNKHWSEMVRAHEDALKEKDSEIQKLHSDILELKASPAAAASEPLPRSDDSALQQLFAQNEALDAQLSEARKQAHLMEAERQSAADEVSAARLAWAGERADMERQVAEALSHLTALRQEQNNISEKYDADLRRLQEAHDDAMASLRLDHSRHVEELTISHENEQRQLISELDAQSAHANVVCSDLRTEMLTLQEKCSTLSAERESLQEELEAARERLCAPPLPAAVVDKEDETAVQHLAVLEKRCVALEAENAELRNTVGSIGKEKELLQHGLSALQSELHARATTSTDDTIAASNTAARVASLEGLVSMLEAQQGERIHELHEVSSQLESLRSANSDLTAKLAAAVGIAEGHEAACSSILQENDSLRAKVFALQTSVSHLEVRLAASTSEAANVCAEKLEAHHSEQLLAVQAAGQVALDAAVREAVETAELRHNAQMRACQHRIHTLEQEILCFAELCDRREVTADQLNETLHLSQHHLELVKSWCEGKVVAAHSAHLADVQRVKDEAGLRAEQQTRIVEEQLTSALNDAEFYRSQCDALEAKLDTITQQVTSSDSDHLHALTLELQGAREATRSAQRDASLYRATIQTLECNAEEQTRQLGSLRQSLELKQQEVDELEKRAVTQERFLHDGKKERQTLQLRTEELAGLLDQVRAELLMRTERMERELTNATVQHSADMAELRASYESEAQRLNAALADVREELAVANALLSAGAVSHHVSANTMNSAGLLATPRGAGGPHSSVTDSSAISHTPTLNTTGTAAGVRASDQVVALQQQLADQARQNQRLLHQLQSAQQEIAEKSNIIRDQDISLSSLGENHDANQQLQSLCERQDAVEARLKKVQRERDALLVEKDAAAAESANATRRIQQKDQLIKRLETEVKAAKSNAQTLKSESAARMRQLSDLRQEVADLQGQCSAYQDALEEADVLQKHTEARVSVTLTALNLFEDKANAVADLVSTVLLNETLLIVSSAVEGFSCSHSNIVRRCDEIDALAQEALNEGMNQNKELRDANKRLSGRVRELEDSLSAADAARQEAENTARRMEADMHSVSSETQDMRSRTSETIGRLNREMLSLQNALSLSQQRCQRLEEEIDSLKSARDADAANWAEERTVLEAQCSHQRSQLKEKHDMLKKLQCESDDTIGALEADVLAARRDANESHRQAASLRTQLDDALPRLDKAEAALLAAESKCAELSRSLTSINRQRDAELESAKAREESDSLELTRLRRDVEHLSAELQSAHHKLEHMTSMNQRHFDELQRAVQREMKVERELAALTESSSKTLEQQAAELQQLQQRQAALQKSLSHAELQTATASEKLAATEQLLNRVESDRAELQREIQILRADATEQAAALRRRTQQAEDKVGYLTAALAESNEARRSLETHVDTFAEDKRKLFEQLENNERLLRDANNHNAAVNRELKHVKTAAAEEHERALAEAEQLRAELMTTRRLCAASDARARDAERTCESSGDAKRRLEEETQTLRAQYATEVERLGQEKQDIQARVVDLQRQAQAFQTEAEHIKRDYADKLMLYASLEQEVQELRSQLHAYSERARAAISEREDVSGQLTALKDEHRRLRTTAERKITELTNQLSDKDAELAAAVSRMQQGSQVFRNSEVGLQQQVTDLTVSLHQLKSELAAVSAAKAAFESSLESERQLVVKGQQEAAQWREKLMQVERECAASQSALHAAATAHEQAVSQLHTDLESLRQHAAEDKRQALQALERVIQADRQALNDVRQARERALRTCDQALREKDEAQKELEALSAQVRTARRDAEDAASELRTVFSVIESAMRELGSHDGLGDSSTHSPSNSRVAPSPTRPSITSLERGAVAAKFSQWMDCIVTKVQSMRRGAESVAVEWQQYRDAQQELVLHERVTADAAEALQQAQLSLRQLSERIEALRGSSSSVHQLPSAMRRSGSRSDDGGSRDSSHDRFGGSGGVVSAQAVRMYRVVLSKLLQQSVLLERCVQSAVTTQEAMHPHFALVEEQLHIIERAAGHHLPQPSTDVVGRSVGDATTHQRVILSAGVAVIATRVAQQTRLLVAMHQQLQRWCGMVQQMPLEELLQPTSTVAPGVASSNQDVVALTNPKHSLVQNPREFAFVFAQGEDFARLSFIAVVSTAPVVSSSGAAHGGPGSRSASAGAAANARESAAQQSRRQPATDRRRSDEESSSLSAAEDVSAELVSDDSDDANNTHEDAVTKTRAFQKMRKENKRLYTLVRNLTERLKTASQQQQQRGNTAGPAGASALGATAHRDPSGVPSAPRGGVLRPHASRSSATTHVNMDVSPIRRDTTPTGSDDDGSARSQGTSSPIPRHVPSTDNGIDALLGGDSSPESSVPVRWVTIPPPS